MNNDDTFNTVTTFADNCAEQNTNHPVVLMALQQVHSGRLKCVEFVFLVSGHSYMPCNRSFGLAEKKIRRFEGIFTPDDYIDIIRSTHKKFRVDKIQQEEFYNLNSLVKAVMKRKTSQGKFSKSSQIE